MIGRIVRNWLILMVVTLAGCMVLPSGEAEPEDLWEIVPGERVGRIGGSTSEQDLSALFGAGNVRRADIELGEGFQVPGTLVYPEDSTKRLEIVWRDDDRQGPAEIRLTGEESRWRTSDGLSLGSSLQEIERVNGGPFRLAGFGWDYSGTILDCNDGKLRSLGWVDPSAPSKGILGRRMLLRLDAGPESFQSTEYQNLLGDHSFLSDHPDMQALNPRVYQMIVYFTQP